MKITVKKELNIERERTLTIRFGNASAEKFCAVCREIMLFITVDEAAIVRRTTARQVFQMVEADLIHFIETDNGLLLVCSQSLSQVADESFCCQKKAVGKILHNKN